MNPGACILDAFVKKVIDAAIAVKNNSFEPQILSDVAARSDALGELA
jgi:two-component system sensor histidine kinase ChiS